MNNFEGYTNTEAAFGFNLLHHLYRQRAFSLKTFGPGERVDGVTDHIAKELVEIKTATTPEERRKEWIDIILLGFDGAWRSGASPEEVILGVIAKQSKNERRNWPDWRTADPGKAIEHVRGTHD